jgi:hypothetical protein
MTTVERPDPGIMVIDHLLSDDDQEQLLAVFENADLTPQSLGRPSGSRTRRRGESRSPDVPRLLWARLASLLPPPPDWYPANRPRPKLEPDLDQWRWRGCNDFTRFYDYGPGDEFRPHFDESWRASPRRRSLLTVLVYLPTGEPYEGGETVVEGHTIEPLPGRVAVFDHRLVHAGQPVVAGRKLVLRNDVIATAEVED